MGSSERRLESVTFYFENQCEVWGPDKVRSLFPLKISFPVGCGVSKIAISYKPPPLSSWERLALDEPWAHKPAPVRQEVYDIVSVTSATTLTIAQTANGTLTSGILTITTSGPHGLTGTTHFGGNGGGPSTASFGNWPPLLHATMEGPSPRNRREQRILRALGPWRIACFVRIVNLLQERERLLRGRNLLDWNSTFWEQVTHDLPRSDKWGSVGSCTPSQRPPFRRRMRRKHLRFSDS